MEWLDCWWAFHRGDDKSCRTVLRELVLAMLYTSHSYYTANARAIVKSKASGNFMRKERIDIMPILNLIGSHWIYRVMDPKYQTLRSETQRLPLFFPLRSIVCIHSPCLLFATPLPNKHCYSSMISSNFFVWLLYTNRLLAAGSADLRRSFLFSARITSSPSPV